MSTPFVAEIRAFPFNFAPNGWAMCNGQVLAISQNTALFSLLGTTYGGDGRSTFGLPNLQGSVPVHAGQGPGLSLYNPGQIGGTATVTLLTAQMPSHTHAVSADADNDNASATSPNVAVPVNAAPFDTFSRSTSPTLGTMNPNMVGIAGSNQPHNNLMPYLVLNYCIALQGVFPARS